MSATALLAIDWGTSAARAYRVDADGAILAERSAPLGIQQVRDGDFGAALAALLGDWAALRAPRIACGMIGSRQGWIEAPYVDCPADLDALAGGLAHVPGRKLAIVPGVACRDGAGIPDVMRGEETQILGALGAGPRSALAVLPGTHSKWVRVGAGRIETFATFMTGELYAVLLAHSILGRMAGVPAGEGTPGDAFARGLLRGLAAGALAHDLFGARTLVLAGGLAPADVPDWLSGLLIGREVRDARIWAAANGGEASRAWVIGNDALAARYARALGDAGIVADMAPAGAAARGLWAVARKAGLVASTGG
jgi:2-dehydro-3-deoxygalactonokinase